MDTVVIVHVINLDRSPERLRSFREANSHLTEIVRFPAIDGRQQDIAALMRDGIIQESSLDRYTAGALGNALSHFSFWQKAATENATLTVCEDDAVFNRHFEQQASAVISELPSDWDLVLWGWNFDAAMVLDLVVSSCIVFGDEERLAGNIAAFQSAAVPTRPMRLLAAFGIHSYSVSPKGARALRDFCVPIREMGLPLRWPQPGHKTVLRSRGIVPNTALDVMMSLAYPMLSALCAFHRSRSRETRHTVRLYLAMFACAIWCSTAARPSYSEPREGWRYVGPAASRCKATKNLPLLPSLA